MCNTQLDMLDGRRKRRNIAGSAKEGKEQEALFLWAAIARRKYPELGLLHHIPNGGRRDAWEALALKKRGVKAGIPDIFLPVARGGSHGLYVELKRIGGKTTIQQDEWVTALREQGYAVHVCKGWENAKKIIEYYLNPGENHA